jgi:integrase
LAIFAPEASDQSGVTPDLTPAGKSKRKSKRKSKAKPAADKDFPLWQRSDGRWCRKINQKVYYFGTNRQAALEEWNRVKDDLFAGRIPRAGSDGLTVGELCDRFLVSKRILVDSGELSPRTWTDYKQTTDRLVKSFGKTRRVDDLASDDFEALRRKLGTTRGVVGIANALRMTRIVFKHAFDAGLIVQPVRFGPSFSVKRDKIRKAAAAREPRMFEADDIRKLLKSADETMGAMILLAVNCGFGQSDLANLPKVAVDLKTGWVTFARVKTGVARRVPLWPETVAAVRQAIAIRPDAKEDADADMVFITKYGRRWTRTSPKGGPIDGIAQEFGKLLTKLNLKRPGLNFYALRHTFATVGGDSVDQVAVNSIMGHLMQGDDMPRRYRHGIDDSRLRAVTDHVRQWLFASKPKAK